MKITLKLYASLGSFLPPAAERNQIQIEIADNLSVGEVLQNFNIPMESCHLILVNGIFTPPVTSHSKQLSSGDVVAVWPPIAGG